MCGRGFAALIVLLTFIAAGVALECYKCTDGENSCTQELNATICSNNDKCVTHTMTITRIVRLKDTQPLSKTLRHCMHPDACKNGTSNFAKIEASDDWSGISESKRFKYKVSNTCVLCDTDFCNEQKN